MSLMKLFKLLLTVAFYFAFTIHAWAQLNVNVYLEEARKDLSNKKYYDAMQKLDLCIAVKPGEYVAYFYRGLCKYYLNDNLGAEQDLTSAVSMFDPLLYDAYHYRSLIRYRLGDFEGAINDINRVIGWEQEQAQASGELYVQRAFFELSLQNFTAVISDCNTALRLNYGQENLYLCKGMAENGINKFDSALINYAIARKLNPKDIDIYIRTGITDDTLGKYKEAIAQYTLALKIDSSSTLAYYYMAEAYLKLNDDKKAMEDFNKVIDIDPMNALAYFNRGVLEAQKNDYTDALADFDKVVTLNPKNIQALLNRAKIKTRLNDFKGALSDYTTAIDLFPYLVETYYDRAKLKEAMNDNAGAKEDYKLGKIMTELSLTRNSFQAANDSTTLMHMLALNANFNGGNQKLPDTANIDLMPVYYLTLKNSGQGKAVCNPVLLKKSNKEYLRLCLTNSKAKLEESGSVQLKTEGRKDSAKQADALLEKALQETSMQLFRAAANDYSEIIKHDSTCAIAYFALGIDICKEIEIAGNLNNNEQETYINKTYRAMNAPANENYKKALTDFSKVIQMEPDFAYAYYNRAYVKYKLQDFDGAIADYNYAVQINPQFADAYYNRGLLLYIENYKMNACQDFGKAGELGLTQAYLIIKVYCEEVTK